MNILRYYLTDPGVDEPQSPSGTGHGATREDAATFTDTATAGQTAFTIVLPSTVEPTAPIVAVYNVTVNGLKKNYGWDYGITWGDKFGPDANRACTVTFYTALTVGDTVSIGYKYGKKIKTQDGKLIALGSWINAGFSRGAMPAPKITVQLDSDSPEPVGIGDNYDYVNNLGAYWHVMTFRINVYSLYSAECKNLTDNVVSTIMMAQHTDQFFMPEMVVDSITNFDFDIDQKLYLRTIMVSIKAREVFGAPT